MKTCKKCGEQLRGKQTSYCSDRCSRLHLKKLYKERNREKVNAYRRAYRKAHYIPKPRKPRKIKPEKIFEIECAFCPDQVFISKRRRKHCPLHYYKLDKKIRFLILERDEFKCQYCGRKAPDVTLEIDHKLPKSKGGKNTPGNLITACSDCNNGKSDVLLSRVL